MNTRYFSRFAPKILLLAVLLFCLSPMQTASADHIRNKAVGMFHKALAPHGKWVHHRNYGNVWYPLNVPINWRPYTNGYWAYTNLNGWLWVSDWSWGWAPFHYGRWVWDDWYGWIWIPGSIWAPAWVFWSYGGDYVAWAPMPPNFMWSPFISYSLYNFNYNRFVPWNCWVIARKHDFPRHRRHRKFIDPGRNRDILKKTRFFNNMTVLDNHIVNQGIPYNQIEKATGIPIEPVEPKVLTDAKEFDQIDRLVRRDEEPVIYRPIDIKPTLEALHNEGGIARQIDERIVSSSPAKIDRETRTGQYFEPGLPGRLTGKPMPPEYRDVDAPRPIRPAPQTDEFQTGSGGITRELDEQDRSGERARKQKDTDHQMMEMEKQMRAEEQRMKQESLEQQERKNVQPSRRDVTIIPWNENGRQENEQQPDQRKLSPESEPRGQQQMEIPQQERAGRQVIERQSEPVQILRMPEPQGQRNITIIPWSSGGRQEIEQHPEQRQILRQPSPQGRQQIDIHQRSGGGSQVIDQQPGQVQIYRQPQMQGRQQIDIHQRGGGGSQVIDQQPGQVQIYRQPQQQGRQQIEIHQRSGGGRQAIDQQPGQVQIYRQPQQQGRQQIEIHQRSGDSRQAIGQQSPSLHGGRGRSPGGFDGRSRNR